MKIDRRVFVALTGAGFLGLRSAAAQSGFPNKPLRLVIAFAPGTGSDVLGRVVADKLSKRLGQTVVPENRPGASGSTGTRFGADGGADGYVLTLGTNATFIVYPVLGTNVPYDPEKDFVPVGGVGQSSMVVVTANNATTPKTLAELIATMKEKRVVFASAGVGTIGHIASAMILNRSGLEATHVPYKGSGDSLRDVLAGEALWSTDPAAAVMSLVNSGQLRALAVTGPERIARIPNVPTVRETIPSVVVTAWWGVFAPAATPPAIVHQLEEALVDVIKDPDTAARFTALEVEPLVMNSSQFRDFVKKETVSWKEFLSKSGIRL